MLIGFSSCEKVSGNAKFDTDQIELDATAQTVEVTASGFNELSVIEEGKPDHDWHISEDCLIEGDWYTLKGKDDWSSFSLTVKENTTGKDRQIKLQGVNLDRQDFMKVVQKAK